MSLQIIPDNPLNPGFVARVEGVDIARGVSDSTAIEIEKAMDKYAVLVFSGQVISDEQQYDFSTHFGEMEKATGDIIAKKDRRLSMDINDISNLDKHGKPLARDDRTRLFTLGNMLWHSDSSFKSIPAKYSLLSAREVPQSGGNTEFADMRAAWTDLDPLLKQQCDGLVCQHSQLYSRGKLGFDDFTDEEREKWQAVRQPLVRQFPGSGQKSLYLSSHIGGIEGWPVPEARLFIQDLTEFATQPDFAYSHSWQKWDLVMWDNRVTMHRARRYNHDIKRDMRRTTVSMGTTA